MQDTVWDFALAKCFMFFSIVTVSMHSVEVTNLCVIKRNFGCFQTLVVVRFYFHSTHFHERCMF